MRVGFDLDHIFINTPSYIPKSFIDRLYRKKTNGELLYRIPSKREQLIRRASHHTFFRPPMKENLAFLQKLAENKKDELYLVSSRYGFLKHATDRVIRKYNLNNLFDKLYFNIDDKQPHLFKTEVLKSLSLDKFVDDDLPLLKYIASRNNKTKLYWLNTKVNKKISPHITAITNLSDMFTR